MATTYAETPHVNTGGWIKHGIIGGIVAAIGMMMAEMIIAAAMGQTAHRHGREGQVGKRPASEIGYHAVRTGDNPGEHIIIFGMLGETLELRVAASNRDCYAQGALLAAEWLIGKKPGLYGMNDVLGL